MNEEHNTQPLRGQVAIVTGGSRGIGESVCLALAAWGAYVVVNYRQAKDQAEAVAAKCQQLAGAARAVQADVSRPAEVERLTTFATDLGQPSILVNNAGLAWTGLFQDTPLEVWQSLLDTNLTGAFLCTKAVLPYMLRMGYGRIINVSSIWGMSGAACEVAYSAAKGGLISMTRALAKELGRTGITVNVVAPGAIATDMTHSLSTEDRAQLIAEIPAGRMGSPEDVAHCVRFLALPNSSYLTGQVISPNGGLLTM
ncbi:elongation factor P 5-aminopentanone reductase [Alicyclobacillus herbarius]|uniref:elongation factor P 5-aminopentanone reductase n=1 Tax=Alicyclobacillus herbarius TaxID=122960 RepID=UPI000685E34F|nr:3-oxoacyl-ACP reductase FabG [Alicyclobacillus herbarius]